MSHQRAALVLNNQVVNVILVQPDAEEGPVVDLPGCQAVLLEEDSMVGVGWGFQNGEFIPPAEEE